MFFGELILGKITTRGTTGGLPDPKTNGLVPCVPVRLNLGLCGTLRIELGSGNWIAPVRPSL